MLFSSTALRTTARRPSAVLALLLVASLTVGACGKTEQAATPEAKAPEAKPANNNPVVVMKTSKGDIEMELFQDKAPLSVKNFLEYAEAGHYDGTIFHRVIKGFMIQGGGFTPDGMQKPNRPPVKNEATNGLKNERGTLAMARTSVVDSATSQFFINHADNAFLDHKAPTPQGFGYAVFGKVTKGMDVVDAIATTATADKGGAFQNRPTEDVVIQSVKRK